jgi:Mrp family chromosome partitioning ATPase
MSGQDRKAQIEERNKAIKESLKGIKNKILVMSGKGGVGKSSVAVNLAVGLAERGYKVGLMDIDLHGPSIPQMLGIPCLQPPAVRSSPEAETSDKIVRLENGKIIPAGYSENLSVVSVECLLEGTDKAVIWRGPLKITVIQQFIADVRWGELDYLVIDSPPGTGDEPLTIAQTILDARALIVTTPQAVSVRDVMKSISFCRDVHMTIIGLVENMSGFVCPDCGKAIDLFGAGGGEKTARKTGIDFVGKIPIIPTVVSACDDGVPALKISEPLRKAFDPVIAAVTAT